MEEIVRVISESKFLLSLVVIVIGYFIYKILKLIIEKSVSSKKFYGKKLTYIKLLGNMLKYVFIVVTFLFVLQVNGVNVSSVIAGLGIVGIIVGFAVQDLLKDVISGFNIVTDDVFSVGDVIKYNGIEGKVISIGFKYTKIRDLYNQNIYVISNGNIQEVVNVSDCNDIIIPISYDEKIEKVEKILSSIVEEVKFYEYVKDCEYLGITDFEKSSISYKIRIYSKPEYKLQVKRRALRTVKKVFDKNDIRIPYNQLDVHMIQKN